MFQTHYEVRGKRPGDGKDILIERVGTHQELIELQADYGETYGPLVFQFKTSPDQESDFGSLEKWLEFRRLENLAIAERRLNG